MRKPIELHAIERASYAPHDLDAAAARAAAHMVKTRARQLARRPLALEALHPGLSAASPEALIAIAQHLVERESRSPRRWFGFGGEINLVSARAALLLGRALRRLQDRLQEKPTQQKTFVP